MNETPTKPTVHRRDLLKMGLGLGLVGMAGPAAAQSFEFKPNQRYPDPAVEILDPSFGKYRIYSASVEQLATGFRWAEGPVWFGDGRYLLFPTFRTIASCAMTKPPGTRASFATRPISPTGLAAIGRAASWSASTP